MGVGRGGWMGVRLYKTPSGHERTAGALPLIRRRLEPTQSGGFPLFFGRRRRETAWALLLGAMPRARICLPLQGEGLTTTVAGT
jgi:hypothetical protein